MVNTKLINSISLVFSILIYFTVIFLIVKIYKTDIEESKKYGFDEDKSIVVKLDDILLNTKKPTTKKIKKPQKKVKKLVKVSPNKEKESKKDSRDIVQKNVKDLFSTMRVKKDANEIEEKLKQEKTRASRLKKQNAKELFKSVDTRENKIVKELQKIKKVLDEKEKKSKEIKRKGEIKDKYISKIQSIIQAQWQETIGTKNGAKATAVIVIDRSGKVLKYKNVTSSFNELFDRKLKAFLDSLINKKFTRYKGEERYLEIKMTFMDVE